MERGRYGGRRPCHLPTFDALSGEYGLLDGAPGDEAVDEHRLVLAVAPNTSHRLGKKGGGTKMI